ncbi:TIGR03086 family metal-binding protein [Nonomuraea sediminis]|uniref:TIGR03086 family metal-binding protein n=1 Tax=Nonomuraea sediminis TaxID=2835864 RepID=UPI00202A8B5C|nr:TIGR03086 family metal-binding protein [Nonomuraea sediminis]
MHTNLNIVALDAVAVRTSVELATHAKPADLARPTPCVGWTLHGLLAHMATQHYGFAAASRGESDLALWKLRPLGDDPVGAYRASAEHVLAAFAGDGVLTRDFPLPEFTAAQIFPARQAIGFHFIDYVVHSWDVARTLDLPLSFTQDVLDAALPIAQAVPTGAYREAPGAAFAPEVPWTGGTTLDRILALLGRDPAWTAPHA